MKAIVDDEVTLSKVISFLRFPLIVGVVLIHCHAGIGGIVGGDAFEKFPIYSYFSFCISQIFSRLAVPLFFFISGFLFFYKVPKFDRKVWMQKLRRRRMTLLCPYVVWNTLYLLLYLVPQIFFPSLRDGKSPMVYDYGWSEYLRSYWDVLSGFPIDYPLWFLRDLILLTLFTPVLFLVVRYLRYVALLALAALWLVDPQMIPLVGCESVFFYTLGAYFSVNKLNFVNIPRSLGRGAWLIYGALVLMELLYCSSSPSWMGYAHRIGIVFGIVSAIYGVANLIRTSGLEMPSVLSNGAFAIYVFHAFPLIFIIKRLQVFCHPFSDLNLIFIYVLSTFLIAVIGIVLYQLARKIHPVLCMILFGNR